MVEHHVTDGGQIKEERLKPGGDSCPENRFETQSQTATRVAVLSILLLTRTRKCRQVK